MSLERLAHTVDRSLMVSWRRAGPGHLVVCVHGVGVSSREMLRLVETLGAAQDAWTVDLSGFRRSAKPSVSTRLLPRGRLTVLPGLPPMVSYRDPHGLTRAVAAFLAKVTP